MTDDALRLIAKLTLSMDTGARGLRTVFEEIMEDIMYTAPDIAKNSRKRNKVVIDENFVRKACEKKYSYILKKAI